MQLLQGLNEQIPYEVLEEAETALDKAFDGTTSAKALCNALRWITMSKTTSHVSVVNVLLALAGYYLTATVEVQNEKEQTQSEYMPISMAFVPC